MRTRLLLTCSLVALVGSALRAPGFAAQPYRLVSDVMIPVEGATIAADIYLPAGWSPGARVPCLVEASPYRKEPRAAEGSSFLPQAGFALVEMDVRGTGGSSGTFRIALSLTEQRDVAQVIEWAADPAENPYCTDKVGMFGGSYSGIIQYLVATLPAADSPPHLAAIAPQRALGDFYRDLAYHGGQPIASVLSYFSARMTANTLVPPQNRDRDQAVLAWGDHLQGNGAFGTPYYLAPFADAIYRPGTSEEQRLYADSSPLERIDQLRVPALHLAGWFDIFARGQPLTFSRALAIERERADGRGPNFLIVGPWNHTGTHFAYYADLRQRLLEFYSHYLRGAPAPSWLSGPRVRYFQMDGAIEYLKGSTPRLPVAPGGQALPELPLGDQDDPSKWAGSWRTADNWPVPGTWVSPLHLRPSGLSAQPPDGPEDLGTLIHEPSGGAMDALGRWDNGQSFPQPDRDQRPDEVKALAFDTVSLAEDLPVTGPIGLRLQARLLAGRAASTPPEVWGVAPPHPDFDLVVKLSDVAPDGTSTVITHGFLRASHRATDPVSSYSIGPDVLAPLHLHTQAALDPPPLGEWRDYEVEVWPTAKTFPAGHVLRLAVYLSDRPSHLGLAWPAVVQLRTTPAAPARLAVPRVGGP
jgi:hypothetical protein